MVPNSRSHAHAADLAKLGESDMLIGTLAGDAPLANAAHHLAWHRALYHHTDVECVFVGQPLNTLALAISGQLPEACNADLARTIGGVVLVEASQLPQTLVDQVANTHAFVIPGLGCLVWGNSPRDTVARADALERAARLTVMITMLRPAHKSAGMPSTLPPPRQQM